MIQFRYVVLLATGEEELQNEAKIGGIVELTATFEGNDLSLVATFAGMLHGGRNADVQVVNQ